jgi:hypothetical protein|tara:strand:+ start:25 stop:594 length:570 start_codon:yes stop_codon:yes gene_type:complete
MKKLLGILVLSLCFITPSQADGVNDFQLEGMSIGESALDFFDEKLIKENVKNWYSDDKFIPVIITLTKSNTYDWVSFHYKKNDKKFKMDGIRGGLKINYNECISKMRKVDQDVASLFSGYKKEVKNNLPHDQDKSGKSFISGFKYQNVNGDRLSVYCTNWHKDMKTENNLNVGIYTSEFMVWIEEKAYK